MCDTIIMPWKKRHEREGKTMERFKHKETGQIGEVVHFKGRTTTLRFEDGSEQIITPANLKRWWVEIDDAGDECMDMEGDIFEPKVKEKVLGAINDYFEIMSIFNSNNPKTSSIPWRSIIHRRSRNSLRR